MKSKVSNFLGSITSKMINPKLDICGQVVAYKKKKKTEDFDKLWERTFNSPVIFFLSYFLYSISALFFKFY